MTAGVSTYDQVAARFAGGPQLGAIAELESLSDLAPNERGSLLSNLASDWDRLKDMEVSQLLVQSSRLSIVEVSFTSDESEQLLGAVAANPAVLSFEALDNESRQRNIEIWIARSIDFYDGSSAQLGLLLAGLAAAAAPFTDLNVATMWLASFGNRADFLGLLSTAQAKEKFTELEIAELRDLPGLSAHTRRAWRQVWTHTGLDKLPPGTPYPLQGCSEWIGLASPRWAEAISRIRSIHHGEAPYKSDAAFNPKDAQVLGRIFRTSFSGQPPFLERDELCEFGELVCQAPDPAVKSAPSQAATIMLGRAVAALPTPDGLAALDAMRKTVRHGGLRKKLDRFDRSARGRLSRRPDLFALVGPSMTIDRRMMTVLKKSFEQLYLLPPFTCRSLGQLISSNEDLSEIAKNLVWKLGEGEDATSVRIIDATWRNVEGDRVTFPDEMPARLWHPITGPEIEAWRSYVFSHKVRQPFAQVFREFYPFGDDDQVGSFMPIFAGVQVEAKTLLGIADSTGWRLGRSGSALRKVVADEEFSFDLTSTIHVGADVAVDIRGASVSRLSGEEATWRDVDSVVRSEIFRQCDLMASVGAVVPSDQGDDNLLPRDRSTQARFAALEHLVKRFEGAGIDGRHVTYGDLRIHVSTGRVSRTGKTVVVDTSGGRTEWIPYKDPILAEILKILSVLVEKRF